MHPNQIVEQSECKRCGVKIDAYELCAKCAKGNDPFVQSKYSYGARGPY